MTKREKVAIVLSLSVKHCSYMHERPSRTCAPEPLSYGHLATTNENPGRNGVRFREVPSWIEPSNKRLNWEVPREMYNERHNYSTATQARKRIMMP